jgi:uncharacterized protein involved in exopolysaccharide biosynthesis
MSLPPALPSTRPERPRLRIVLVLAGLVGLFLLAALGLLAYRLMQPRWYMAQVTIEIEREEGFDLPSPEETAGRHLWALRQPEVLDRVVQALNLTKSYAQEGESVTAEQARERLRQSVGLQLNPRERRIVYIHAYDRDPNRAANIANMLTISYRNQLLKPFRKTLDRALSQYTDEVEKQRASVRIAAEELQKVRERDQIADPDPERADAVIAGGKKDDYSAAKTAYLQARRILENAEAALSKARQEGTREDLPFRLLERAVPPIKPTAWWRGDPRGKNEVTAIAPYRFK